MGIGEPSYLFKDYPEIGGRLSGQVEREGDFFNALNFLDESGGLRTTFKTLNESLRGSFFTMLKMGSTSEAFYPKTIELHVRRLDNQEMELGPFTTVVEAVISEEERQRVNVFRRKDRTWCVISPKLDRPCC